MRMCVNYIHNQIFLEMINQDSFLNLKLLLLSHPTVPLFGLKTILEVCWRHVQAAVPQQSAILVGDLLSCKLTVSVGHRGLCAVAAHWPVVTGLAETEALCGRP